MRRLFSQLQSVTVTCVPVLQVFGFDLSHLAAGEVKHLLTEELQDDHVVLTQTLTGATRSHDVTDERGPVLRPLLLQDLHTNRNTVSHALSQDHDSKNTPEMMLTCTRIMLSFAM